MIEPLPMEVTLEKLDGLLQRAAAGTLQAGDYEIIAAMVETIKILKLAVEEKGDSIRRLLQMIFGAKTETSKNILSDPETAPAASDNPKDTAAACPKDDPSPPEEKKKAPGHGRNGVAQYTGAVWIKVTHSTLKTGDHCPECPTGKLYPVKDPQRGTVIRITGVPPIQGRIYDLEELRCNICGASLSPDLPAGAGPDKYDASARSMIALLKYGCGFPFYRLELLQESLGVPLPSSTQWEQAEAGAAPILPAYLELTRLAAQGEIVHNDDTTARILEMIAENKTKDDASRTGMFTSGLVSITGGIKIALFITGRHHAGENLSDLLARRAEGLEPPIQMCDALSRNLPQNIKTSLANCLFHARHNFVDVFENFPQACSFVIKILGQVYHNDSEIKAQNLSPEQRLIFHKQETGPLMEELHTWLNQQLEEKLVEPNSGLGKAIKYMLKHWEALTLFLRVPGAPLDNNICERALKMAILHRKNSLFYKTGHGAYIGDMYMSLIHTCRLSGVNPFNYLTALQKHAAEVRQNPHLWMPWNYQTTLAALPP